MWQFNALLSKAIAREFSLSGEEVDEMMIIVGTQVWGAAHEINWFLWGQKSRRRTPQPRASDGPEKWRRTLAIRTARGQRTGATDYTTTLASVDLDQGPSDR